MSEQLFALYLRTSVTGARASAGDPLPGSSDAHDSAAWQRDVAERLIAPAGGRIIVEYHDIDVSREIPWSRRPEAARLLDDLMSADRRWDALVVAEPQRAWSGGQVNLVLPRLTHAGVTLWVPECGGPVDPDSDSHDMLLGLWGSMSRGERRRVQTRTRNAVAAKAREGRWLGGRAPYGYVVVDTDVPHPQPRMRALGVMLKTLEPDPTTAPIVRRMFQMFDDGLGYGAIAATFQAEGHPPPGLVGPRPHPRATGHWSKSAVRALLTNPKFLGRQVAGRQKRYDALISPEHPAEGTISRQRWTTKDKWIVADQQSWPSIVSEDLWLRVNARIEDNRGSRPQQRRPPRSAPGTYLLTGLIRCGHCGAAMNGAVMQSKKMKAPVTYYRCAGRPGFPTKDHPRPISIREDHAVAAIDRWLEHEFSPDGRRRTIETILAAQANEAESEPPKVVAARDALRRLPQEQERVMAALRAGLDPALAAAQSNNIQAELVAAEATVTAWSASSLSARLFSAEEIESLLTFAGGGVALIQSQGRPDRAAFYKSLGLELTHNAAGPDPKIEARVLLATNGSLSIGGGGQI